MYTCSKCQKEFKKELNLQLHLKADKCHLSCKECDLIFSKNTNLNRHMKTQHPPTPIVVDPALTDFLTNKQWGKEKFTPQYVYDHIIKPREFVETLLLKMYCRERVSVYSDTVGSLFCNVYIKDKWHRMVYTHVLDLMINNIVEIAETNYKAQPHDKDLSLIHI